LDAAEAIRELRAVFHGAELTFRIRVVVGNIRSAVGLGDAQVIVVLYGSGEGLTNPVPADGTINGASPPRPVLQVSATAAGQPAQVLYAGGVTGSTAGLLQINLQIPTDVPAGLLPVVLTVGTNSSQGEATIAVQ
jgi:uncharacterized protein (TIGR03437 family)